MTEKEHDIYKNTIGEESTNIDTTSSEKIDLIIDETVIHTKDKLQDLQSHIVENNIQKQIESDNTIHENTIEKNAIIDTTTQEVLLLKEEIEKQDQTSKKRKSILQESPGKGDNTLSVNYPTQTEIDANRLKASQNPTLLWQQASLNDYTNPIVRAFMTPIIRSAQRLGKKTLET